VSITIFIAFPPHKKLFDYLFHPFYFTPLPPPVQTLKVFINFKSDKIDLILSS